MIRCIMSGVLAGIVIFLWSFVSWMILPWHMNVLKSFNNEANVAEVLRANATQSGMYLLPLKEMETSQVQTIKPSVFASVRLEGMDPSMTSAIVISLLSGILAAIFVGWLLMQTTGLSFVGRVGFVLVIALAASLMTPVENWNWFAFDNKYTLVTIADLLIGWFFGGLVLARFCHRR